MRGKLLVVVALAVILAVIAGVAWLGHPVCTPIADADLKDFRPVSIDQREDRDLFRFRTFQKRGDHWCQCKSWISRQFFF